MGLHDGGGNQHHGIEEHADAQNGHQPGGELQLFTGVEAQQGGNGSCQHRKPDGTGDRHKTGDPGGSLLRLFRTHGILYSQLCRDGGNDADGDGGDEGAGHIENGLGHGVDAPHSVGLGLGIALAQEPAHVDLGLQHGENLKSRGADGDGDRDNEKPLHGVGVGADGLLGDGQLPEASAEPAEQVQRADETADGDA